MDIKKELEEIGKQMRIANMIKYAYHKGQHHSMLSSMDEEIEKNLKNKE